MKITANLSLWQRAAYVALGSGTVVAGVLFAKMPLLIGVLAMGVVVAGLGIVGFCPLCYFVKGGRS